MTGLSDAARGSLNRIRGELDNGHHEFYCQSSHGIAVSVRVPASVSFTIAADLCVLTPPTYQSQQPK